MCGGNRGEEEEEKEGLRLGTLFLIMVQKMRTCGGIR